MNELSLLIALVITNLLSSLNTQVEGLFVPDPDVLAGGQKGVMWYILREYPRTCLDKFPDPQLLGLSSRYRSSGFL